MVYLNLNLNLALQVPSTVPVYDILINTKFSTCYSLYSCYIYTTVYTYII